MAISFIGAASADATSVALPVGWQPGDLGIAIARRTSSSLPAAASGWTTLDTATGGTGDSVRVSTRVLQVGDTTGGSYGSATNVMVLVYRGASVVGAWDKLAEGSGTLFNFPALTLTVTDGSSWVVAVATHRTDTTNTKVIAPTGTTNRTAGLTSTLLGAADTAGGVAAWSAQTEPCVSQNHTGWSLELVAASGGGPLDLGSLSFESLAEVATGPLAVVFNGYRRAVPGLSLPWVMALPEPTGGAEAHDRALLAASYRPEESGLGALTFTALADVILGALHRTVELGPLSFTAAGEIQLRAVLGSLTFEAAAGVTLGALHRTVELAPLSFTAAGDVRVRRAFRVRRSVFNPVTFFIEVDTGRDLTFATELSASTQAIVASYGMLDSFEEVAAPAALRVVLANHDGRFLPERADQPFFDLLVPGPLVRFGAVHDGVTYTLWQGRLTSLNVAPGQWQWPRNAEMSAADPMDALLDAEYKPPLQTNVRIDQALTGMFEADVTPWPYHDAPAVVSTYTDFETGRSNLAWVGDNAEQDNAGIVRAQFFIRDLLPAECGGRFYWDAPAAKWGFHNREHDIDSVVLTTLSGADLLPEESLYVFGDKLTNRVSFDIAPRTVGAAGTVVYSYPNPPLYVDKKTPKNIKTMTVRYADPAYPAVRVGAMDVIPPVAGTDYEALDDPLPKGGDRTAAQIVTIEAWADRADITLTNTDDNDDVWYTKLQLRGTPLYSFDRQTVTEEDSASIDRYGPHAQPGTLLPNVDDADFARALAQWAIAQYAAPFGRFAYVSFKATQSEALRLAALQRRVGDRIRVQVAHLNHDRDYTIVGIEHIIDVALGQHHCRWILRPLPLYDWLVLDDDVYGLLDGENRLIL